MRGLLRQLHPWMTDPLGLWRAVTQRPEEETTTTTTRPVVVVVVVSWRGSPALVLLAMPLDWLELMLLVRSSQNQQSVKQIALLEPGARPCDVEVPLRATAMQSTSGDYAPAWHAPVELEAHTWQGSGPASGGGVTHRSRVLVMGAPVARPRPAVTRTATPRLEARPPFAPHPRVVGMSRVCIEPA